ncbi:uncharacterized protein LOC132904449 [Amyelois transitella]|uniref:uncharacterized protein LOC132902196 n=1 Tax=Amyelois transitella TaxID=680683 RepID=UPI0029900FFC|nr:uncharacterized protein LOC132902196 [Amyelois transitella]XP_060810196.1 uncharacterized protein LOC132904285 [Amyelois transitella]XP_060810898.1 uncharacterized protein LOC132904449 [Amyelois transitella]
MFCCASCGGKHTEGVICSACKQHFDFQCSGITEAGYRKLGDRKNTWRCPKCKSGAVSPQPNQMDRMQDQLEKIMSQLTPLASLVEDVKTIKNEIGGLKDSLEMAHDQIKSFVDKVNSLEIKIDEVQKVADEVPVLKAEIQRLNQELGERDQWARSNNVEIRGIPLKNSENLYEIVQKVATLCNYPIKNDDINYIARIPTRNSASEKPIVMALNNRYKKEAFVASARKCNELNLINLGYSTAGNFYVNDHLTLSNKELLRKARSTAKEKNFQYVWVKHCKIMVRKSDTSPIIFIKNDKDLLKIK